MKKMVPGVLAGLVVSLALAAPASAGPTVTVRVEGAASTLLERTQVTLPDTGNSAVCNGTAGTVAQALDIATSGNWDRQPFAQTILGETHDFSDERLLGAVERQRRKLRLQQDRGSVRSRDGGRRRGADPRRPQPRARLPPTAFPLGLRGLPAAVQAGTPVTAAVVRFALDGTASPVARRHGERRRRDRHHGAAGKATLTFAADRGRDRQGVRSRAVVSAGERITVSSTPVAPGRPAAPARTRRRARTRPRRRRRSPASARATHAGAAPRELRGTVSADASGIKSVRLAVTRRGKAGCTAYDGVRERFKTHRCGGWKSFRIGDRADWSYLLPKRLGRGRYTIRVIAIDKAGNDGATQTRIRVR